MKLSKQCPPSALKSIVWIALSLLLVFFYGCSCPANGGVKHRESKMGIAKPASVNCLNKGGELSIQKRGDGGEYGICVFEDNRQCEEWSLFRGECPVGGKKITGYVTPAAQYCVITGGIYTITAKSNTDQEQGTCSFDSGSICDVWDYFNGKCYKHKE